MLTSNTSVALEGIFGGLPAKPEAYSGLQVMRHTSPTFMVATAMSQALMTSPVGTESKQVLLPWLGTDSGLSGPRVQCLRGSWTLFSNRTRKVEMHGCKQCCHLRPLIKQTEKQNCSALEERSSRNKAVTSEEEVGYSQRKERNQYTSRIAGEKGVTTTKICSLH